MIASDDPSEKASGRGPGILRDDGREVEFAQGAEAAAARLLNQAFRKHSRTGLPLVTLKMASSLDGKVATRTGDSKWISGERSRALVHRWRAESDAVAIGIGTALADDALLTARDIDPPAARQPARVVFDSGARLPLDSKLVALDRRGAAVRHDRPGRPGRPDRRARRPPAQKSSQLLRGLTPSHLALPSSAAAASPASCSRAARRSRGRSSTPGRSTSCASSSPRC